MPPIISFLIPLSISLMYRPAYADNDTEGLTHHKAWQLFQKTRVELAQQLNPNHRLQDATAILARSCEQQWDTSALQRAYLNEAEDYASDLGFKVRVGITSGNLTETFEPNDGATYAELSWDILNQGLYNNRLAAEQSTITAKILATESAAENITQEYQCRHYQIGQQFAALELQLLEIKRAFIQPIFEKELHAYFSSESYLDELFLSDEDLRQVNENIRVISELFWLDDSMDRTFSAHAVNPPVASVNINAIIDKVKQSQRASRLKSLNQQNMRLAAKKSKSQLRLFVRQEFEAGRFQTDDLVTGLRFTMPLSKPDDSALNLRLKQTLQDIDQNEWLKSRRLFTAYQQISEQAERVTKQQFAVLRSNERLQRIENYQVSGINIDPVAALVRLRTYIDGAIELVKAKRALYQRISTLFAVAQIPFEPNYLQLSPISETSYRARPHQRLIVLNDEQISFNSTGTKSSEIIAQLLQTKAIDGIVTNQKSSAQETLPSIITHDILKSQRLNNSSYLNWQVVAFKQFEQPQQRQRLLAKNNSTQYFLFDIRDLSKAVVDEASLQQTLSAFAEEAHIFSDNKPTFFVANSVSLARRILNTVESSTVLMDLDSDSPQQLLQQTAPLKKYIEQGRLGYWLPAAALQNETTLENWIVEIGQETVEPLFIIDDINVYQSVGGANK